MAVHSLSVLIDVFTAYECFDLGCGLVEALRSQCDFHPP
jgi:hypothetical protein